MLFSRFHIDFSIVTLKIGIVFMILVMVLALAAAGFNPAAAQPTGQIEQPVDGWTAYNDCVYNPSSQYIGSNVTTFGIGATFTGSTSGELLDQATGTATGVTAAFSQSGGVVWEPKPAKGGHDTALGTDAYNTFHTKADMTGVISYGSRDGWYVDLTISGLDPLKEYTFATSAARSQGSFSNQVTLFTISSVDVSTNASTSGVTVISNLSVAFSTGDNHSKGYVARWTGIQPGADGSFVVRASPSSSTKNGYRAYAFDVFMLQEEFTPPPGQVSVAIKTDGDGSVSLNPVGGTYAVGTSVQITAQPYIGWHFVEWTEDFSGTDNPANIILSEDMEITADFARNTLTITVAIIGNGSTDAVPADPYHLSDAVQLTALPATGWRFLEWRGDLTGTTNPATIFINGNKNVTAVFVPGTTFLTVNVIGSGTVTKAPGDPYHLSEAVELTAIPADGWKFAKWSGDLSGSNNPETIILNTYKTVNAIFEEIVP